MATRRVVTANSVWSFDFDSLTAIRLPRHESPDHPLLPYQDVGKAFGFSALTWFCDNPAFKKLSVKVNEPGHECDGHRIDTGEIIEDSNPDLWLEEGD